MKIVVVVGAGLADAPIGDLDGKTPLDRARTPHLDHIASRGIFGLTRTISRGAPIDRDAGLLAVLGYGPGENAAAGVLEALGLGVALGPGDVAFRCDLVGLETAADGRLVLRDPAATLADPEMGRTLAVDLAPALAGSGLILHPGLGHRHVLVWPGGDERVGTKAPYAMVGKPLDGALPEGPGADALRTLIDRSQSLLAAHPVCRALREQGGAAPGAFWPWGGGRRPSLQGMARLGVTGALVAVAPHAIGAGLLAGLARVPPAVAAGSLDTDLRATVEQGLRALDRHDLVVIHVEGPNTAALLGDPQRKVGAIERLDEEVVGPVLEGLRQRGGAWRLLVTSDHAAPSATRAPSAEPVPFAVYVSDDDQKTRGVDRGFSERDAREQGIFTPEAHGLLQRMCRRAEPATAPARDA
jgi:2,3-bisphosphoglycerate-independent phosphoglycerate mutase